MPESKSKALTGLKWSAIERILTQGMQFVMMIVIARQLSPGDFGLVGMLTIFMAISQTFIDSGFSSALIRKGEPSETECATAFYFNVVVGIACYGLLFAASPLIASFYGEPILESLTKIIGLNVLFSSLAVVQRAKLTIALDFKKQSVISLIAVVVSGALGIAMAYTGFGVWALAAQTVAMNLLVALLLWVLVRWVPVEPFCWATFKELFGFGSKLLASGLLDTLYKNIYQIIIGKQFSASQLGYFAKAKQFSELPAMNITQIIQRVNFPLMSQIKDDDAQLEQAYARALKYAAMLIFPLMAGLAVLAEPVIQIVLNDQWLPAVPMLSLLCMTAMLYPIHAINLNLLQVKGRSDWFLKLEIIKKTITTITLFITVPQGVMAMCVGMVVNSFMALFVNTHYTGKLLGLTTKKQMQQLLPVAAGTVLASLAGWLVLVNVSEPLLQIVLGGLAGFVVYVVSVRRFCRDEYREVVHRVFSDYKTA